MAALAGWLLYRSRHDIAVMLRQVSPALLLASILLTVLAKGMLAENARVAAVRNGIALDFPTAARLYNLSQLGKYLPGSIWQFVGRAAAYRQRGAGYAAIRDALLVESLWIVAGAALAGIVLTGPAMARLVAHGLGDVPAGWAVAAVAVGLSLLAAAALWKRHWALRYLTLAWPSLRVLAVQAGIWGLLGLAFWVVARACGVDVPPVFAIGLFAIGYAMGFLVPFAPAGLGVRDAVLTFGLLPWSTAGEALAVTVLARLVYLLVDVGLALGQEPVLALLEAGRKRRKG